MKPLKTVDFTVNVTGDEETTADAVKALVSEVIPEWKTEHTQAQVSAAISLYRRQLYSLNSHSLPLEILNIIQFNVQPMDLPLVNHTPSYDIK